MSRRTLLSSLTGLICLLGVLAPAIAQADFGFVEGKAGFDGFLSNAEGGAATQAGSHPFEAETTFSLDTIMNPSGHPVPDGNVRDIEVELPPGLVGDPTAAPTCTQAQLHASPSTCPSESQVGTISVTLGDSFGTIVNGPIAVYNVVPPRGKAGELAFVVVTTPVYIDFEIAPSRTHNSEYALKLKINNISETLPVIATTLKLWGAPTAAVHDPERFCPTGGKGNCPEPVAEPGKPLVTLPSTCRGPQVTTIQADSWQEPGNFHKDSFLSHDATDNPIGATGCESLGFEPSFTLSPEPAEADSPAGLGVDVQMGQKDDPEGIANSQLEDATIQLPAGLAVNPSAAAGLVGCKEAEVGLGETTPVSCPNGSKLGTVSVDTPLFTHPLSGTIYLAQPHQNRFGSLLASYIAVEDPATGVVVKLAGQISTDPGTGQLSFSFLENPQVPFEDLKVKLFTGPRAALTLPPSCGSFEATGTFAPWSGNASAQTSAGLPVSAAGGNCPSGAVSVDLHAGSASSTAGAFSPFVFELRRNDGTQRLSGLAANLPPGLLADLAGIPYCSDPTLAGIPAGDGSGAAQLDSPSCPAASQVGTLTVAAGSGPSPFQLDTGKAYLAGPYKGAPLSLGFVVPALAGPFDLGNVVVRAALQVNPETAQVSAVSDPLPTILDGIPLDLRQLKVDLDRDHFTVNPTSCELMAIGATVAGSGGGTANIATPFQASSCQGLPFKPRLSLKLSGPTRRGAFPALRAELKTRPGEANLRRVSVALPRSEFLAQSHIRTICTRVQFAALQCPAGSVYGTARAFSPLLEKPLEGPVYLRSSDHKLPDLVADLQGQIRIDLDGRIDSHGKEIRDTFEVVPDAPVSKFVLELPRGKKGLLVNSENLCQKGAATRATVNRGGQNGKVFNGKVKFGLHCGSGPLTPKRSRPKLARDGGAPEG